ncbi:MAG: hypothetical protein ACLUOI_12835 [Eisenbergiella sp.]
MGEVPYGEETTEYFYGSESEQFTFYRIPKLLFTAEYYQHEL